MDIFRSSDDYEVLVAIVRDASAATGMDVNGYVFMRNHFHIVVTPQQETAVEKAMHAIGFKYARYINDRYKRTGAVFEGRYRSTLIDTERYWYLCLRYVELNPVRAGFVSTPHAYYWSSYATHASGSPDPLVTLHPQYLALGRTPRERQECWRRHCADAFQPGELETIRKAVHGGGVLGALVIPDEDG